MKPRLVLFLLCFSCAFTVCARATVLPDACGSDKVQFDVSTEKHQPKPSPPPAGKAQIVFTESWDKPMNVFGAPTIRVGVDGTWVGATQGNSYFALTVDPGVHHLCVSWQSIMGTLKKNIGMASFTAAPDKVYYYATQITVDNDRNITFDFSPLDQDEGAYRVKAGKLAVSTVQEEDTGDDAP